MLEKITAGSNGRHPDREDREQLEEHPINLVMNPQAVVEDAVYQILENVGEDPERDGLKRTPHRVAKMYTELLEGYCLDVKTVLNDAMFDVEYGEGEMVVVADIEYSSMCEHHMLPFVGKAHVAYLPGDKVVGLSKIPRIVDMFARRLQVWAAQRKGETRCQLRFRSPSWSARSCWSRPSPCWRTPRTCRRWRATS